MTTAVQLPVPALWATGAGRSAYAVLWPQRWGFFADAADTGVVVAHLDDGTGHLAPEPAQRHLSGPNLWGLRRTSDALQDEIAYLTGRLPDDAWTPCAAPDPAGCAAPRPDRPVVNDYSAPRLCGRVVLAVLGPETRDTAGGRVRTSRPVTSVAAVRSHCPGR